MIEQDDEGPKVKIPTWVITVVVSILIAFVTAMGATSRGNEARAERMAKLEASDTQIKQHVDDIQQSINQRLSSIEAKQDRIEAKLDVVLEERK